MLAVGMLIDPVESVFDTAGKMGLKDNLVCKEEWEFWKEHRVLGSRYVRPPHKEENPFCYALVRGRKGFFYTRLANEICLSPIDGSALM